MRRASEATKEKFIVAAIRELNESGISGFSVRHIAEICGVSYGAPYKHYKGKHDLLRAVIDYVNKQWFRTRDAVLDRCGSNPRRALIECATACIRFLCTHPEYHAVFLLGGPKDAEKTMYRGRVVFLVQAQLDRYFSSVSYDEADREKKTFLVRSLVCGAAQMLAAGELPSSEETVQMVHKCLEREFDLV